MEEAAEHVHGVVGVHGGEHQVPGERRLDGDLGGLRVADLADQDLVRVVAQDGAQPPAKVRPFFSLTGIWVTPRSWYSTGSSMVMILSSGVDLVERGVERGGLARAGGAGDQHHAVGLPDVSAQPLQIVGREAHHVQPSFLNFSGMVSLSSMRITAFSPWTVGMMETRKSMSGP